MIARYAGATLGLFAFAIVIVAGLFVRNPLEITLSRGIFALFGFCLLGFVIGGAAQLVVNEHEKSHTARLKQRYGQDEKKPDAATNSPAPVHTGRT